MTTLGLLMFGYFSNEVKVEFGVGGGLITRVNKLVYWLVLLRTLVN